MRELASIASATKSLVFLCVGAQNQILDCETSEEYLFSVILVASLKAIELWHDCSLSSKLIVFLRRQGCGGAPIRKDLGNFHVDHH